MLATIVVDTSLVDDYTPEWLRLVNHDVCFLRAIYFSSHDALV